jgi:hypothetical protein
VKGGNAHWVRNPTARMAHFKRWSETVDNYEFPKTPSVSSQPDSAEEGHAVKMGDDFDFEVVAGVAGDLYAPTFHEISPTLLPGGLHLCKTAPRLRLELRTRRGRTTATEKLTFHRGSLESL